MFKLAELAIKVDKNVPIPEPKRRGRPKGSKKSTPIPELDTKRIEQAVISNILAKRLLPFINKPVQYYDEGYRVGILLLVGDQIAIIKPPLNGRNVRIPVEDVKGRVLKAKLLNKDATLPTCAHPGEDLAFDIYSNCDVQLIQHVPVPIYTDVAAQFHDSYGISKYGLLVRDRSSMAQKGIFCTGGVIDSGYTGEIIIFLTDQFSRGVPYEIKAGDKIAQLIPIKVRTEGGVLKVDELDQSKRGEKGFGSTGNRVGIFG